jgi:hypothetical protein
VIYACLGCIVAVEKYIMTIASLIKEMSDKRLSAMDSSHCISEAIVSSWSSGRVGRTVAQAVSRWLLTAAAQVRVLAACGVCGGQSDTGAGFLRVLRFPLPLIPPISPLS